MGISAVLAIVASLALLWQSLRCREAEARRNESESRLEKLQAVKAQQDVEISELTSRVSVETAHVEQLQRQLEYAREEVTSVRGELRQQSAQVSEVQSAASAARAQYSQLTRQHEDLKEANARLQQVHDALQERFASLSKDHATLSSTLEQKQQNFLEQQQLLKESRDQLKLEFEQLAGQIFEAKGQAFSQHSQQSLDALLKPYREQIESFRTKVEDIHHKDVQQQAVLGQELHQLKELNRLITQEAQDLTTALKGQKKAQGNWGELILENVLERSGLILGRDFEREVSFNGDSGRQRPDVIVHLPQNKHLIIDAKVSLNAYTRYINAEDETERRIARRACRCGRAAYQGTG